MYRTLLLLIALAEAARAAASFEASVRPVIAKYCAGCHNAKLETGRLDLTRYRSAAAVRKAPEVWERVAERLRFGSMPPAGLPQPKAAEITAVTRWIEVTLQRNRVRHSAP